MPFWPFWPSRRPPWRPVGRGRAGEDGECERDSARSHVESPDQQSQSTTNTPPGTSGDRDVRGKSTDPSAPNHDTDNGKGNNCDPGLGGAVNNNANFKRFSSDQTDSTSGCSSASGVSGQSTSTPPTTGFGGGVEAAQTSVAPHGGVLGATGMGGGVAAATGVALANTGLRSIGLALLALLLVSLGFYLIRRRSAAGTS